MKDSKLCGCIGCRDAHYRAVAIVRKAIADDECPITIYGLAAALQTVASNLMLASMVQTNKEMEDELPLALIQEFSVNSAKRAMASVNGAYNGFITDNEEALNAEFTALVDEIDKRAGELEKLPKGD